MISNGPHIFGSTQISFIPHDKALNNRTAIFTHEAWLMMLGPILWLKRLFPPLGSSLSEKKIIIIWLELWSRLEFLLR
jgi:hypothetical protein